MDIATTLSNLQPVIIVGMVIVMLGVENIWPYFSKSAKTKRREGRNFLLALISFIINGGVGLLVLSVLQFVSVHKLGLLNWVPLHATLSIIAGVILLDFGDYVGHVLAHKVPLFWRSHRVHHSDLYLSTSSSLRFHPFDVMYSQVLAYSIAIVIFGVSPLSYIVYGTMGMPLLIAQHSNVKFPVWFEKYGSYIFATPGWHRVHHAADQKFTDSHYSDLFSIWDRLFGTWHKVDPKTLEYGLHEFKEENKQTVGYLLSVPFKNIKRG